MIIKIIVGIIESSLLIPLLVLMMRVYFFRYKKLFIVIIKHLMRIIGFCSGILGYRYEDYK